MSVDMYTIKEGANNPSLVVDLFDRFGTPDQSPLQGLDGDGVVITFIFKHSEKTKADTPDLMRAGENYVDPAEPGVYKAAAQFLWGPTDTESIGAGAINFEINVQWVVGQIEKFPNKGYFQFMIEENLEGGE